MQQTVTTRDAEIRHHQSAFRPICGGPKSPVELLRHRQRDSGYGSDFSPAVVKSSTRRFTYGGDELLELCDTLDDVDLCSDEEVFTDCAIPNVSAIAEENEDADKEVETLFIHSGNFTSQNEVCRPSAPLPPTDAFPNRDNDMCLIASPYYHTQWQSRDKFHARHSFRPIVSRGTQTANPHCQLVLDALRSDTFTCRHDRLRIKQTAPLPDVVPVARDRSMSLPDEQAFQKHEQEQHVGRELRRISDDFHSTYLQRHGHRQRTRSLDSYLSSGLGMVPGCWNSLRRFLSRSPLFQTYRRDGH